jgi:hypothetical protein
MKGMARLPKGTSSDLLLKMGLISTKSLQAGVETEFLINCLLSPDMHCRVSSQIWYCLVEYERSRRISPFSSSGLEIRWTKIRSLPPIFKDVKSTLLLTKQNIHIEFDTRPQFSSRMINQTLYPLAVSQVFSSKWNFQSTTVLQLFQLLHKEGMCVLSDISPLFVHRASVEHWSTSKDWSLNTTTEACARLGITLLKRGIGRTPGLGAVKKSILTALILWRLCTPSRSLLSMQAPALLLPGASLKWVRSKVAKCILTAPSMSLRTKQDLQLFLQMT